ncbi:MAG: methionine adenosyltransferase [Candidatus Sungbacteria bacterium]|nr:methionine adenosyltransferase [Candidatus Sungbacteria bacterium]
MKNKVYTVESVASGHPDKMCDQISDAILDAYLAEDPFSRVAVETFGSHGLLVIGGEVTSKAEVNAAAVAQRLYREIGYRDPLTVMVNISRQSPDIAQGVDGGGAGDQGIMYGYATSETPEFLPPAVTLVHKLTRGLENLRRGDPQCSWLGPDGKAQITIRHGKVAAVLVSCQHEDSIGQDAIREHLIKKLIVPSIGDLEGAEILVNPTGKFVIGGFAADTGLTGRKIMVDTYCALVPHGGGAFSGKDPTKVDRSAAYMCRFAAKNIVASGLSKECSVAVAYAIGRAEPLMIWAEDEEGKDISALVAEKFDFRPAAIIERLDLRRPLYLKTAVYGHFGKDGLPWEEIVTL